MKRTGLQECHHLTGETSSTSPVRLWDSLSKSWRLVFLCLFIPARHFSFYSSLNLFSNRMHFYSTVCTVYVSERSLECSMLDMLTFQTTFAFHGLNIQYQIWISRRCIVIKLKKHDRIYSSKYIMSRSMSWILHSGRSPGSGLQLTIAWWKICRSKSGALYHWLVELQNHRTP